MKRPSPKVLANMQARLGNMKGYLQRVRVIADGIDTPFWQAVKAMYQQKIREVEEIVKDPQQHDKITGEARTILTTRWGDFHPGILSSGRSHLM